MRIKITLSVNSPCIIDFNYQHQIQTIIYKFLARSNPDYSAWLHQQGFLYKNDKRFKLFVFSGITFNAPIRINNSNKPFGYALNAAFNSPFTFSFQIASPVDRFIQHLIEGIFREGSEITFGRETINVYRVETLSNPLDNLNGAKSIKIKPLESPIFVKKPMPKGMQDVYLYPGDKDYEYLLNQNLCQKYEILYGKPFKNELLKYHFFFKEKSEKMFTIFKKKGDGTREEIHIKGSLRSFVVTGQIELIKIGMECGFGQNNSMGCGYVEINRDEQDIQDINMKVNSWPFVANYGG